MKYQVFFLIFGVVFVAVFSVKSFGLDAATEKAMVETKRVLVDRGQREHTLNETPKGQAMGKAVKDLAGSPEDEQKIYELAAQLMERLMRESNGDPAKLQEKLLEAQKNPEQFSKRFTAEEAAALRGVAGSIEKKSGQKTQP